MDLTGRAQSTVARLEAMPEADADTAHRTHTWFYYEHDS